MSPDPPLAAPSVCFAESSSFVGVPQGSLLGSLLFSRYIIWLISPSPLTLNTIYMLTTYTFQATPDTCLSIPIFTWMCNRHLKFIISKLVYNTPFPTPPLPQKICFFSIFPISLNVNSMLPRAQTPQPLGSSLTLLFLLYS